MIGLECLLATVGILERSDVIRAFPKRFTSSCNFARSGKGLTGKSFKQMVKKAEHILQISVEAEELAKT